MYLRHLPRPTSKPGLLILGGVLLLCFIGIALVFVQIRQPRTRMVLEAPTVVLSPAEQASYPRPPIHPQARQTQVHLTTRPGCIDNCEGFEPLHGLGQRFSEFTVGLPTSEVLSFYQTTLLAQGWMRVSSEAFNYDELKKTPGIEPPPLPPHWNEAYVYRSGAGQPQFSLELFIEAAEPQETRVELIEVVAEPYTWSQQ